MKIAIDARGINLYEGTGIGTYTDNLLKQFINLDMINEYTLFWTGENYDNFLRKNFAIKLSSKKSHRFFQEYYFPIQCLKNKIDIYHVPQNGIGLSENTYCKKIVTIHDLIPYSMPETVGKGYLIKFLKEMPKIIEMSDGIITVSEYSKKDILRFFPINPDKIFVTPLAADKKYKPLDKSYCKNFLLENYKIDKPFILYLGGFSERKNVASLINAFYKIKNSLNNNYKLVIVGDNKDSGNALMKLCDKLNILLDVTFTGYVSENVLPIFYNGCEVFVYPSLYEGFGLPPLEAMSCGTAVLTSDLTSIPEVVGNGGLLFNPLQDNALVDSLMKILCDKDLKYNIISEAIKRSKDFSWEKTAKATVDVYNKVYSM